MNMDGFRSERWIIADGTMEGKRTEMTIPDVRDQRNKCIWNNTTTDFSAKQNKNDDCETIQ